MLELAAGWQIEIDDSPEWLFFRIETTAPEEPYPPLSETLWLITEKHGANHIVFELDDSAMLVSYLVGQLVLLHKRAHLAGGTVRVCGLSPSNYSVIERLRFADRFPNYATREDAISGHLPGKPR